MTKDVKPLPALPSRARFDASGLSHPAYLQGKFKYEYFSSDVWEVGRERAVVSKDAVPAILEAAFISKDVGFRETEDAKFDVQKFSITRTTTLDDRKFFASIYSHELQDNVAEVNLASDSFVINMFRSEKNSLPFSVKDFLEVVYRAKIEVELDHRAEMRRLHDVKAEDPSV